MDNTMEHDKSLTDAHQSMRPCHVVLEKIDLDNYNLKKKKNSRKAPERSAEMLKWRRSVIQKRNRLRGYIHTPEEYERKRVNAQMRQKNFTPEQRTRMKARTALCNKRLRERQRRRLQSQRPGDMEQELERRKVLNRIKSVKRVERNLALTEEEREAQKTAARLAYKNKHKLTDEQHELKKARIRDRCIAKQMLKYVTEQDSIHGSDSLTEEQREIYRAKLMLKYVTAKENGQNRVNWGDCLTDEQRERRITRKRLRYRAKIMLNNETTKQRNPENIPCRETLTDEKRKWKNARDRERRKDIMAALKNGEKIHNPYSLTDEQRERKKAQNRERYRAKMMLNNGPPKKRTPENIPRKKTLSDEQRELKNARDRERRKAIRTAIKNGENIRNPRILTDKQRERKNLLRRERRQAKKILKNRTANHIEKDSTHGREGATQNEQ